MLAVEADVGDPDIEGQVFAASFAHHECKTASVCGGRGRRRTPLAQFGEAFVLGVCEALGASRDPVGDPTDGHVGQGSGLRDRAVAVGLQVPHGRC